jgi:hypothetical protein
MKTHWAIYDMHRACVGENTNLGHGILKRLMPGMTVLTKACSNVTDRPAVRLQFKEKEVGVR